MQRTDAEKFNKHASLYSTIEASVFIKYAPYTIGENYVFGVSVSPAPSAVFQCALYTTCCKRLAVKSDYLWDNVPDSCHTIVITILTISYHDISSITVIGSVCFVDWVYSETCKPYILWIGILSTVLYKKLLVFLSYMLRLWYKRLVLFYVAFEIPTQVRLAMTYFNAEMIACY